MSSLDHLRNYRCWIGENPVKIRRAVRAQGGWHKVFPSSEPFPQWAHRVRNYFNEKPNKLQLLEDYSREWKRARSAVKDGPGIWSVTALTLDIYKDETGRYWHEMATLGTVYHYPGKVNSSKKARAFFNSQMFIPVFKLISPDGTGGSCEICIHNWQLGLTRSGKRKIGETGKWVNVSRKHVVSGEYQGSYNYSETVLKGLGAHEYRDVDPHEVMKLPYADPPMNQKIESRQFPLRDRKGRAIAGITR